METINVIRSILLIIVACGHAEIYLDNHEFEELGYMNLTADPCENFYEYTCGNFKNLYTLQDGYTVIDQFTILEDTLADVVHGILEADVHSNDPIALKKAKIAYEACTDNSFKDSQQMRYPEVEVIKRYGGFPVIGSIDIDQFKRTEKSDPNFGWDQIADISAEFGISIFLSPILYYDTQNATRNILRISTDSMDIPVQFRPKSSGSYEDAIEEGFIAMANQSAPSTDGRLKAEGTIPAMEILLRRLVLKLKRVLGSDRTDEHIFERVANISNFMKGIYYGGYIPEGTVIEPITNDSSASEVTLRQLNEWTYKHFGDSVQLDWVQYVKRLLQYTYVEVDENFLVLQPIGLSNTLYGVLNWVRMNDVEIVKSSALLRAFVYTATDSDSETRAYFEEYLKAIGKTVYPRWKYCSRKIMDVTGTLSLSLALAYEYQLNYFNNSKLSNAATLISNLQTTFKEVIEEASWMDDESKAAAQTKADNIITLLGYPEFIKKSQQLDHFYENLEITTWNHYENAKKLRAFQLAYTLNMISERVRTAWEKSPFNANAYYNRQNNRIIFPMAMLHPLFFQGTVGLLDYSRIGMIIAHEITHGFDGQGFLYNPDGVIEPWWTNETIQNFVLNTQCFIEQYSKYAIPEINSTMNGSGSLNENLADNGGLRTTFRTFKKLFQTNSTRYNMVTSDSDGTPEFTVEQMFFIGYGTMWCNVESVEYLQALQKACDSTTTCHARSDMRVNGVVSNMEEFAEAFNCPVGSAMNPANRCRLW